jgi:hypothetical protein
VTDERYGRSADLRLHDLRRVELGLPPRASILTSYVAPENLTAVEEDEDDAFAASGSVLVAALDAQPRIALIPGALITIVLNVVNDGKAAATGVRANVALPVDTTYRPGTLAIDGTPGNDAIAYDLFENGTDLGEIESGARKTVIVKLVVEAGVGDILLTPHVSAAAGAVLGLRAMRLSRAAPSGRGVVVERPFYESDADELASEPPVARMNQSTITVLQPPVYPPIHIPVVPGGPKTTPQAGTKPSPRGISGPSRIESVRSNEDTFSVTGQGGPILTVRIDRKRLKTLTRLFSGPSLGTIAHYLVLNALAVTDALPGDGADGSLAAFVAQQEKLLSRALIAIRLGKTPAPDTVSARLPPFPPRIAAHAEECRIAAPVAGEAILVRALAADDLIALERIVSNPAAAPFERSAQLFVGLCANDVIIADERERRHAGKVLAAYAALATDEIGRIFPPGKPSRAPAPFRPTDGDLDDAARTVLAALEPGLK